MPSVLLLHAGKTSRDHDFTDWDAVERFAHACAADLAARAAPAG